VLHIAGMAAYFVNKKLIIKFKKHPFIGLFFQDNLGKTVEKGRSILDFTEVRYDGMAVA